MKVLIVEDEVRTANNLRVFITENFEAVAVAGVCGDGEAALAFLKRNPVDMVLTDISMPGMDGLALIRQVHRQYPDIAIVVLSAYSNFEYVREAFLHGARDYLLKPLDRVELAKILTSDRPGDQSAAQPSREEANRKIVLTVKQLVKEQLAGAITLGGLAKAVYMNPQYLSSLFKEQTGEPLFSYVARCRVERAQKLLAQSALKIYEIAEMTGYADTKYFSSVFKKYTGLTPGEYRERGGKESDNPGEVLNKSD